MHGRAKVIDIGAFRDSSAMRLLRCDVARSALDSFFRRPDLTSLAQINDLHHGIVDEHVRGLDVRMDDAGLMHRKKPFRDTREDPDVLQQRFPLNRVDTGSIYVLHDQSHFHDPELAPSSKQPADPTNRLVFQSGSDPLLLDDLINEPLVLVTPLHHMLECEFLTLSRIPNSIDGAGCAVTEPPEHRISKEFDWMRHGGPDSARMQSMPQVGFRSPPASRQDRPRDDRGLQLPALAR